MRATNSMVFGIDTRPAIRNNMITVLMDGELLV